MPTQQSNSAVPKRPSPAAGQMSREEIVAGIERLKPFLLRVDLPHNLRTDGTPRLQGLMEHSWGALLEECGGSLRGKRVLDVACVNGGFSLEAAKAGADYVWGFDVVPHYIEQSRFLRDACGFKNIDFDVLDLNDLTPEVKGMFDVTFCFGIMYHLENPISAMRRIASVTKNILFVDTNIVPGNQPVFRFVTRNAVDETDDAEKMAGRWRTTAVAQMKPSKNAVIETLKFLGFKTVKFIEPHAGTQHERYIEERTGSFIAIR